VTTEDGVPEHPPLVLVIEDEQPMRRMLEAALASQGYKVVEAVNGEEGLRQAGMRSPDLVLLDLGLPDLDGLAVTRRLREWSTVPIIVLSARGLEQDKITALDAGADDYVTKPFAMGELLARMRVALRHEALGGRDAGNAVLEHGEVRIDLVQRRVQRAGQDVKLTPIEFRLLAALAQFPGRVLTHEQLLRKVWGPGYASQRHYLRVYMAQLRHKLEANPARPELLITEPGVGYRLGRT
jgi:two-component system KDP operon response regulator KdpE